MDPFLARTMVENLSKGIDPRSGIALPQQDSCADEEIQNALLEILAHCTIESNAQYLFRLKAEQRMARAETRALNEKKYPRSGEPWSKAEDQQLCQMHQKGYGIYKIANLLKRTPGAVDSQLRKLQGKPVRRSKK